MIGRSVHLTPSGIDFDEHVFQLGQGTVVRAAGSLIFPRCLFILSFPRRLTRDSTPLVTSPCLGRTMSECAEASALLRNLACGQCMSC